MHLIIHKMEEKMKFAAIKGNMGIWRYYVSALTFEDIAKYVSPITKEISNSDSYSNLLQRAITNNVSAITEYLLLQPERMFNALVLAVYDGNPDWFELDVEVEDYSTFSVGVLELTGNETIFPVDGQHRVAGIKEALEKDESLANEKVPIILIGHEDTPEGKRRTRRLFSTLNRRAKRVNENEIIALDEDDLVAIATRDVAENHILFSDKRLVDCATKNIPSSNTVAFTSILTLYEINKIIYVENCNEKGITKVKQEKRLLYRPSDEEVNEFIAHVNKFWDMFVDRISIMKEYVSTDTVNNKIKYRSEEGGNLLFRPIALSQFVLAIYEYKKRKKVSMEEAIEKLGKIPMNISEMPWKNLLWLEERKNINGRIKKKDLKLLMLFLVDETLLQEKEKRELIQYIMGVKDLEESDYDNVLDVLRKMAL